MCLFCKIAHGEIPVTPLFEDDTTLAFADLHPQAPTHILIIPKNHLASHAHATQDDAAILGHLLHVAGEVARQQKLTNGYRLVINTGPDGGQTVDHLHIHLLGGRPMHWPPGLHLSHPTGPASARSIPGMWRTRAPSVLS